MANIVCFGEVLWDVFPSYKTIGGAPLNVALRLNSFTNNVHIISSVGKDVYGTDLLNYIEKQGLNISYIQINEEFKTSEVIVSLDQAGSASYSIEFPCAWDYITINENILIVTKNSEAFIYGSLIARNKVSYSTLLKLMTVAPFKVFDINLRSPHYKTPIIIELMQKADFIKFNDEELFQICNTLQFDSTNLKKNIQFISRFTNTDLICVTLGENGAVLYINRTFYFNNGYKVNVIDTVGAGDSFLAALIDKLLKKETPQNAIDFASAIGALVVSNEGANQKVSTRDIKLLMSK